MPVEKATKLLMAERGVHFEENIVDAFFRYYNKQAEKPKPYPLASSHS
jgi:HD-GYP domain-containing protein (c-di-GMP phosphodiesterase class II)